MANDPEEKQPSASPKKDEPSAVTPPAAASEPASKAPATPAATAAKPPAAIGAKLKPYECGVEAEGDTRGRYSVRFYIVAILFVIFDVETTFLFPWAVLFSTREEGFRLEPVYALASMFVFLGILIIGYVWLYRKGALEWV